MKTSELDHGVVEEGLMDLGFKHTSLCAVVQHLNHFPMVRVMLNWELIHILKQALFILMASYLASFAYLAYLASLAYLECYWLS